MHLPDAHPSLQRGHIEGLLGTTRLPESAVSAACVLSKDLLDDVVTYIRAGQMSPTEMRRISATLLGLSTQLALHADATEREMVRAAAVDGSEL